MAQQTVRQYVDTHYVNVDNHTCRLIAARVRSHCIRHKIQFCRVRLSANGSRYSNLYDVEALARICGQMVGLRKKR